MAECDFSVEKLRELMEYDPNTGNVTWRVSRTHKTHIGKPVGSKDFRGCIRGRIGKQRFYVHRIAWALHYGRWPSGVIDHINGDPSDNRIANLREATAQVNQQNFRRPNRNNKTGYLGVTATQGHFYAKLHTNGKTLFVGSFKTPEEASAAYLEAKRKHHIGCTI